MTTACAPPAWFVALKALHYFSPTECGCGENGWWCAECQRCAPCNTMRVASGGKATVLALHFVTDATFKRWKGWFRKREIVHYHACAADGKPYPCNTVRLIEAEA